MKKSNVSLMVIAAVAAITSAFATRPDACLQCEDALQYHKMGTSYTPLGEFGVDYDCDFQEAVTCTYYKPNPGGQPNVYAPCRLGVWIDVAGRIQK